MKVEHRGITLKEAHPIYANPANTILLVVDMQNEFCKPGGAIFDHELSPTQMTTVIDATRGLTHKAREVGIPIIHIQSLRTLEEPEFTAFNERPIVKEGTWAAEIIDELKPQEHDIVVEAWSHDPFHRTRLDYIVKGLADVPTNSQVIITGGHICGSVYLTVMGFYFRHYWTVVPLDTLYGDDEGMEFSLKQFSKDNLPSIFFTRSDLVEFSKVPETSVRGLTPNT